MLFNQSTDKEAMLYYLFMAADGEISYSEKKLFDEICKQIHLSEDVKKEVESKCKQLISTDSNVMNIIKEQKLDEELKSNSAMLFFGRSKTEQAKTIWNLVNIGYADKHYSQEEKDIVNYFVDVLGVSKELFQEMIDTADTILALTKEKDWVASKYPAGKEKDTKDKELDKEIDKCFKNIKLSIEEIRM